jgi:hypothetical protein
VDLEDYDILSVETEDALGNTNRLVIKKHRRTERLAPELFSLKIPPGTVVLDAEGRELSPSEIEQIRRELRSQKGRQP